MTTVYVLNCHSSSADDFAVFRTQEGAEVEALKWAAEHWRDDPYKRLNGPMPSNLDDAVQALADADIAWISIDERPLEA
jgi:hypothetical protein